MSILTKEEVANIRKSLREIELRKDNSHSEIERRFAERMHDCWARATVLFLLESHEELLREK